MSKNEVYKYIPPYLGHLINFNNYSLKLKRKKGVGITWLCYTQSRSNKRNKN